MVTEETMRYFWVWHGLLLILALMKNEELDESC